MGGSSRVTQGPCRLVSASKWSHRPRPYHQDDPIPATPWHHATSANGPCGLIASQSQQSLQTKRTYSVVLASHVPGRDKPFLEREFGCGQRSFLRSPIRCERIVSKTSGELPSAIGQPFAHSHLGHSETCWPPQPFTIRGTGLLIGKPGTKLLPRSWMRVINIKWLKMSVKCVANGDVPPLSFLVSGQSCKSRSKQNEKGRTYHEEGILSHVQHSLSSRRSLR
jgi:hypothetical protein